MLSLINKDFQVPDYYFAVLDKDNQHFYGKDKIYNLCSISKFITTLLCLKLIEEGSLTLSTSLQSFADSDSQIRIDDILRHKSGIIDNELDFVDNIAVDKQTFRYNYNLSSSKAFAYSDHAFVMLELFLENRYDMSFTDLIDFKIFKPLGMENMYYIESLSAIDPSTFAKGFDKYNNLIPHCYSVYPFPAACGLWAKGSDLVLLMNEVLNSFNNRSSLGMTSNCYNQLTSSSIHDWLGLGCFLDTTPNGGIEINTLGWGLGYQSMVVLHPQQDKGLIVLTNKDTGHHQMKGFCGAVYKQWLAGNL